MLNNNLADSFVPVFCKLRPRRFRSPLPYKHCIPMNNAHYACLTIYIYTPSCKSSTRLSTRILWIPICSSAVWSSPWNTSGCTVSSRGQCEGRGRRRRRMRDATSVGCGSNVTFRCLRRMSFDRYCLADLEAEPDCILLKHIGSFNQQILYLQQLIRLISVENLTQVCSLFFCITAT